MAFEKNKKLLITPNAYEYVCISVNVYNYVRMWRERERERDRERDLEGRVGSNKDTLLSIRRT